MRLATALATMMLVARVVIGEEPDAAHQITVAKGRTVALLVVGTVKSTVSGPDLFDVKSLGGNELLILGVNAGKGSLLIYLKDGKREHYLITVVEPDAAGLKAKIDAELRGVDGVSIRVVGDSLFLEGCAQTSEGDRRVRAVVACYPEVMDLSTCDYVAFDAAHKRQVRRGGQIAITVSGPIEQAAIADERIVDAKVLGAHDVLVSGLEKGETFLIVKLKGKGRETFGISVRPRSDAEAAAEEKLLDGEQPRLDEMLSPGDEQKLKAILNRFPEGPRDGG